MMRALAGLRQKNETREKADDGVRGTKGYLEPLGLLALGLCVAAGSSLSGSDPAVLDYERLTRYTARVSFLFFLPVFTLSALSHFLRHPACSPCGRGVANSASPLGSPIYVTSERSCFFTSIREPGSPQTIALRSSSTPYWASSGHLKHACGPHPRETVAPYPLGGELRALCGLFATYLGRLRRPARSSTSCFHLASAAWALRLAAFFQSAAPGPWKRAGGFPRPLQALRLAPRSATPARRQMPHPSPASARPWPQANPPGP